MIAGGLVFIHGFWNIREQGWSKNALPAENRTNE
jgi:hypothetical protein